MSSLLHLTAQDNKGPGNQPKENRETDINNVHHNNILPRTSLPLLLNLAN
jgi:hypothetical protein